MRDRFVYLVFCLVAGLMIVACSPGLYVKMDSTATERTPVFIGMKRHEAELHLGTPLFIARMNGDQYKGIYEYQVSPGAGDTLSYDIMDFTTLGLGHLIVSPLDRSKVRSHLVAVVYQMEDESLNNDRVVDINEQIKVTME